MDKQMVINMTNVPKKWLKLMLKLQNSVPTVYRMVLPDQKTARKAVHNMLSTIDNNPTWFRMVIIQRGSTVFVIKEDAVQNVVILNEKVEELQ